MAEVQLSTFLPNIRPAVPGCPQSLMEQAVRDACIRLCIDSWILREDIAAGDILVDVDDYLIIPSQNSRMISLVSILYKGRELPKKTEEELDHIDPGWRTAGPGDATYVTMTEPDRVRLNRVPSETTVGGFIPRIITKPAEDTQLVDQRLYNDWRKGIEYGALSLLLEIPKKKWSDMEMSVWYGKKFNFEIQRAKDRARMSYFKKSTSVRNRAWV